MVAAEFHAIFPGVHRNSHLHLHGLSPPPHRNNGKHGLHVPRTPLDVCVGCPVSPSPRLRPHPREQLPKGTFWFGPGRCANNPVNNYTEFIAGDPVYSSCEMWGPGLLALPSHLPHAKQLVWPPWPPPPPPMTCAAFVAREVCTTCGCGDPKSCIACTYMFRGERSEH